MKNIEKIEFRNLRWSISWANEVFIAKQWGKGVLYTVIRFIGCYNCPFGLFRYKNIAGGIFKMIYNQSETLSTRSEIHQKRTQSGYGTRFLETSVFSEHSWSTSKKIFCNIINKYCRLFKRILVQVGVALEDIISNK